MEKKSRVRQDVLPPAHLYLEDFEEIIRLLKSVPGFGVEIADDEALFGSLAEFMQHRGKRPKRIEVVARDPREKDSITISFGARPYGLARIKARENLAAEGAYENVRRLVSGRRRWFTRLSPSASAFPIVSALLLLAIVPMAKIFGGNNPWLIAYTLVWGGALFLWLNVTLGMLYIIELTPRHSVEPFLTKNRDLLLVLLGAILGAALKFLADWVLKKISP